MSHTRIHVDLILHATAEALVTIAKNAMRSDDMEAGIYPSTLADALTRCIRPDALAEEWSAGGETQAAATWLADIVINPTSPCKNPNSAYTRAIEIAVARRLADTACAIRITGDAEDTARAEALWRAAGAIVGMQAEPVAAPPGFKVPTMAEVAAMRDPPLAALAKALGVQASVELVSAARAVKAQADRAGTYRESHLRAARICEHISAILGDPSGDLPAHVKALVTERDTAKADAARRLNTITEHDKADADTAAALGAHDGEDNFAAAKRVRDERDAAAREASAAMLRRNELRKALSEMTIERDDALRRLSNLTNDRNSLIAAAIAEVEVSKIKTNTELIEWRSWMQEFPTTGAGMTWETARAEVKRAVAERDALKGRDPCETCRNDRRESIVERNRIHALLNDSIKSCAQMQVKLVTAERERDAAQEEVKGARVGLSEINSILGEWYAWMQEFPTTGAGMTWAQARDEVKRLALGGRAEDVRPIHDEFTYPAMRAGVPMWMCLMTGPGKYGGRWSLETSSGKLRICWPSGIIHDLHEPIKVVTPARA